MIWNTIVHPKMMNAASGTGSTIAFSKEALESPIKHMNRDLLATFDYIVWFNHTSLSSVPAANSFAKTTLLIGDFETLFAAGKNKTIVNGLSISSMLGIRKNPDTGAIEYYPVETDGMSYSIRQFPLTMPKSLYGKMTMGDRKFDFGKDRFVMIPVSDGIIVISSYGEVLLDGEIEPELMKYVVKGESDKA